MEIFWVLYIQMQETQMPVYVKKKKKWLFWDINLIGCLHVRVFAVFFKIIFLLCRKKKSAHIDSYKSMHTYTHLHKQAERMELTIRLMAQASDLSSTLLSITCLIVLWHTFKWLVFFCYVTEVFKKRWHKPAHEWDAES